MFKRLKKIFSKETAESIETEKVKVFSFAGHTFRILQPGQLSTKRQLAIHSSSHERDLGISVENYSGAMKAACGTLQMPAEWTTVKDLVSKLQKNAEDVRMLLEDVRVLLEEDYAYKPFIKSACAFILVDDESVIDDPHGKYYDLKIELCNRHSEIECFFLQVSVDRQRSILSTYDASKCWEFYPDTSLKAVENKIIKVIQSANV